MRKKLIVSTGEKGGVGKSTALLPIIEEAHARGLRVFLIEGDPSIPDLQRRYQGWLPGVQISLARADNAGDALVELMNRIEKRLEDADVLILNLPAGSASIIDQQADVLIEPCLDAFDLDLCVLAPIGPGIESVQCLQASRTHGLCRFADLAIALPNAFFGETGRFSWSGSKTRQEWLETGGLEFELPRLIPRIADKIREEKGFLSDLAAGTQGSLTVVERAALNAWLRQCEPIVQTALGDLDGHDESAEEQTA